MQQLLIISETTNHLTGALIRTLEDISYRTVVLPGDIDAVNHFQDTVNGILIFATEKLVKQQQALLFLKDRMVIQEIPFFAIGNPDDLEELYRVIPKYLIRLEFIRPISLHIREVAEKIDGFIKQNNQKKKILVVDDSGAALRSVKGWLEEKYTVFLANSAAMAIKYLTLNRPDLILLDYDMPIADGKQAFEMIRAEMEFTDIPIIFLTGKVDTDSIMKVVGLKPEGCLLKTMPPERIVRAVDHFFYKQKIPL